MTVTPWRRSWGVTLNVGDNHATMTYYVEGSISKSNFGPLSINDNDKHPCATSTLDISIVPMTC